MIRRHRRSAARRLLPAIGVIGWSVVLFGTARCTKSSGPVPPQRSAALRVGFGRVVQQTPQGGLRQFSSNFSLEGLVNLKEDGRPRPWLAEGWATSRDGLYLTVRLRPSAK